MTERTHQPRAGMCRTCTKRNEDCSHLKFEKMRVIKLYQDGTKVVRCSEHIKDQNA